MEQVTRIGTTGVGVASVVMRITVARGSGDKESAMSASEILTRDAWWSHEFQLRSRCRMWNKLLCRFFGHKPMEQTIFSALCERCDETLYFGPVKDQGRAWGRQKYADRNKKPDYFDKTKPKYAVSEEGAA